MDLSRIPVIDHHIHIFSSVRNTDDLGFSITSYPTPRKHLSSSMTYRIMISELRRFFHMEGATAQEVMAERNRRFDADPRGYIQSLLADANIRILICDLDAPISAYWTGNYRTDAEAYEFFDTIEPDVTVGRVVRIEIACNKRLKDNLPFDEFVKVFRSDLIGEMEKFHAIAIKSVIGYFTGLEVSNPTEEEARAAYEKFLANRKDSASEKIWRDYMLHRGADICAEKDVPLQIHTGWGDTPYGDLRRLSAFLLYDFLREEHVRKINVVLLHAGYPYSREAGILASQLPNVYVDLSEMIPYAGYAADTVLLELMEAAPTTKLIFGTDGGGTPEPVWLGAIYVKKALKLILEGWMAKGYITEAEAFEIAEDILYKNALGLYPSLSI